MNASSWARASLLTVVVLLSGCTYQNRSSRDSANAALPPPEPAPTPVPEETIARFKRLDPNGLYGRVISSRPEDRLVRVGDVPVNRFRVGDTVMFYGSGDVSLGGGTVVDIANNSLYVEYPPASGHRAPTAGDMAVTFKK